MDHFFYGKPICPRSEQEYIKGLLKKYRNYTPSDDLHKCIWEELQRAKAEGLLSIPFKVVFQKDSAGRFPDYIEIILDTKL